MTLEQGSDMVSVSAADWVGCYPLANNPRSPALARMLVRQALAGSSPELVGTAELLVSELVTNAVMHAQTDVLLHIALQPTLRVTVEDCSADPPAGRPRTADHEDGRGLAVLAALATRWGWQPTATGKSTWFEL